ncbi:MAG TPA: ATP-binding protein [Usitatibacteraceae bacterium]
MIRIPRVLVGIRAQLLLVSLFLLFIPLIGFRFVMDMQSYLRTGQQQVLVSAAHLLSATLSDRPQLMPRELALQSGEEEERRRLVALFGSSDPETASSLGAAYQPSEEIERILAVVAKNASRIWVVDARSRVRGLSGNLSVADAPSAPTTGIQTVLRHLIRPLMNSFFPAGPASVVADDPALAERAVMSQVDRALNGEPTQLWRYAKDMHTVVLSAAQPIWSGDEIVGAVVVEESAGGNQAITVAALESLLTTSLVVFLVGGLALILFASRLTYRVERLRMDADRAIDAHGRITGAIAGSRSRDEIGALARTLEEVLHRLARYNAYLEQMASRLAHELRTPVAVVRSSLDNLRHADMARSERIYIERADEGVKRLSLLIARMSEAAQLEGILQGSEKEYFDLAAVVSGCVDGYRLVYPSAQFEFSRPSNPIMIKGLPDAIAQLLDKLIQNATDFAAPDTAIVTSVFTESGDALLTVENRGPAISAAVLPTLFTSMVSAREHGGNQHSHLGLGLYIVRLIADFHGGDVSASNLRDNSGVRFEFRIPLG